MALRAVWQLYTHVSSDTFILGRSNGKACYCATSTGLEHGAVGPKSLTFTPAPTAPTFLKFQLCFVSRGYDIVASNSCGTFC